MGNKLHTNVTSGIKEQAAGTTKMYYFTDLKGGGELVELMKKANRTKNYTALDILIRDELKPFLYNEGRGKMVHIRDIVSARCNRKLIDKKKKHYVGGMEALAVDDRYLNEHGMQLPIVAVGRPFMSAAPRSYRPLFNRGSCFRTRRAANT